MAARTMKFDTLTTSQQERVLTVRFDSPPLNFIDSRFARDLRRLVTGVERDPSIGAVVVTGGRPDRFLTHFDVAELSAAARFPTPVLTHPAGTAIALAGLATTRVPGGNQLWERFGGALGRSLVTLGRLHSVIHSIRRSGVVYLAAINGPCLGGGLEFALACDLRHVGDDDNIRLGQPEILGGILPGAGGTQNLPRIVGTGRALEMVLEGELLSPKEALELGLVHRVTPQADLVAEAQATAARLASRSRIAVSSVKRAVHASNQTPRLGLLIESGGLIASGRSAHSRRLGEVYRTELERLGDTPLLVDPVPWQEGRV